MLSKEDADGLLTGYKDLDNLTNGLKAAEMVVVAARLSVENEFSDEYCRKYCFFS